MNPGIYKVTVNRIENPEKGPCTCEISHDSNISNQQEKEDYNNK